MPRVHRCYYHDCRKPVQVGQRYCDEHAGLMERNRQSDKDYDNRRHRDTERNDRHKFYTSKPWRKLRLDVMDRDMNLCQYCALNDRVTVADMVDHIVPREVDISKELDMSNLVASCNSCHRLKQDWEQKHYGTGQRNKIDSNALLIKDISFIKGVFKRS